MIIYKPRMMGITTIMDYEHERNKLIPEAEKHALRFCRDPRYKRAGEKRTETYNRLFHAEMTRLCKEKGI